MLRLEVLSNAGDDREAVCRAKRSGHVNVEKYISNLIANNLVLTQIDDLISNFLGDYEETNLSSNFPLLISSLNLLIPTIAPPTNYFACSFKIIQEHTQSCHDDNEREITTIWTDITTTTEYILSFYVNPSNSSQIIFEHDCKTYVTITQGQWLDVSDTETEDEMMDVENSLMSLSC